jgi:hypothetical protein
MISSISSSDGTGRTNPAFSAGQPATRAPRPTADQISTDGASMLKVALGSQPEIRPEVVARARLLAADPGYPPAAIMKNVARQILAAPDLSEDAS